MYVVGTAGHVDHGKSALVKALTGIDPDRLREEQERGMTIDLGFAWLRLPDGEQVSIVDVPGHERFIKNMLAGVGGIDLALLVIAADEGVMPQTREHLAILDLLQVKRGLLVVTKADLVEEEWLALVGEEVREAVKGTVLAEAPLLVCSAYTGQGLPELVNAIQEALAQTPPKRDLGRPRLPIDRVFTISGFGTVVTGTLIDGTLAVGQEIVVLPGSVHSRLRSLQIHRNRVEAAPAGARVAANLVAVATDDLSRGQVVTLPGWLQPTIALDVRLRVLPDWPHPLEHNSVLLFHTGTAEVQARLRLLDHETLEPGGEGWAQLRLDSPVALAKGDFFILRSPIGTLGGGQVVEPHAPRHRRFHPTTLTRLESLLDSDLEAVLRSTVEQREPVTVRELALRSHLRLEQVQPVLAQVVAAGDLIALGGSPAAPGTLLFTRQGWEVATKQALDAVEAYHKAYPLRPGLPREELKSRLRLPPVAFGPALERWLAEGTLVEAGSAVRLPGHLASLTPSQEAKAAAFLARLEASPFAPPTDQQLEPELLAYLLHSGRAVRVGEDVIFPATTYQEAVARIRSALEEQGTITVAQVRDLFGSSRKYALALLEHLDEIKVTRRIGDERRLNR
jgi:selenocysteine-specific elongation factor